MVQEDMFNIGKIINTHGVSGEMKVLRITDFSDRFSPGNTVYLAMDAGHEKTIIDTHRIHKGFDLVRFKGYESIEDAEPFKDVYIQVHESQLTELEENAFYYHEIIGCIVYLVTGEQLGFVKEILAPGANDVWVVENHDGNDILIPYIKDVVQKVDIQNKQIVITPMEGLLD